MVAILGARTTKRTAFFARIRQDLTRRGLVQKVSATKAQGWYVYPISIKSTAVYSLADPCDEES